MLGLIYLTMIECPKHDWMYHFATKSLHHRHMFWFYFRGQQGVYFIYIITARRFAATLSLRHRSACGFDEMATSRGVDFIKFGHGKRVSIWSRGQFTRNSNTLDTPWRNQSKSKWVCNGYICWSCSVSRVVFAIFLFALLTARRTLVQNESFSFKNYTYS